MSLEVYEQDERGDFVERPATEADRRALSRRWAGVRPMFRVFYASETPTRLQRARWSVETLVWRMRWYAYWLSELWPLLRDWWRCDWWEPPWRHRP